ncbi:MAG: TonB-dependent receptor [Burkholderiales bacterium]|nr:TonB-dependent receptor [Burkholderiales bacterium]
MLKTTTALAAALACSCSLHAQTPTELPELTNSATRGERRVDDVSSSVSVHGKTAQARDLKDLLRDEPALSVRAANPRFSLAGSAVGRSGGEGLNVRGLEGNQVLLMVDGIRQAQSFSFGPFVTGRLALLNLEAGQTLEVLRGPASTQYGSDGLAGALTLRTLQASDLLQSGQTQALRAIASWHGVDDGRGLNLAGAWRSGGLDLLLQGSTRRSQAVDTQGQVGGEGATRTQPDPVDRERHTFLAKLGLALDAAQRLHLTAEGIDQRETWDLLSARSSASLRTDARDHTERQRLSLSWQLDDLDAPWLQQASLHLYRQGSELRQRSFEDRATLADRSRDNRYEEAVTGLSLLAQSNQGAHRFTAGVDASRTDVSALRDGTVPPAGEAFPSKPFPDTDYRLLGAFVQGELNWGDWQWVPALRYERFELKPSSVGYADAVVPLADSAMSPLLGLLWRAHEAFAPYLQWAKGFKAPTPAQVNNGFSNLLQGYRSIGNPNLRAEEADSRELGLRGQVAGWRWQLSAFDNRYQDFISQQQVSGSGRPGDPITFQAINLAGARILGQEAKLSGTLAPGWQLNAAAARAKGHSTQGATRSLLDSVEPAKLSLGLRHQAAWGHAGATLQHLRAKGASASGTQFLPPEATLLELQAGWRFLPGWELLARVDNATDRRYWRWSDVRGVSATSASVIDAATAPGRQFSVLLQATL